MTEKEKMLSGNLYCAQDKNLVKQNKNAKRLTRLFNNTTENDTQKRLNILKELLGAMGGNISIEPIFRCDYGYNISIGNNFFANYDCTILDVCTVTIGNNVLLGPRVNIFTASHPTDSEVRNSGLEYGSPISIGNDVWIGGNTVINPGVKIGNNVIIGSGSVVTKDIPDNMIAVGNPCKVLRSISEEDKIYWQQKQKEYNLI